MVAMEEGIKVLAKRNVKLVLPALATMHRDTWTLKVLETHPLFFLIYNLINLFIFGFAGLFSSLWCVGATLQLGCAGFPLQ